MRNLHLVIELRERSGSGARTTSLRRSASPESSACLPDLVDQSRRRRRRAGSRARRPINATILFSDLQGFCRKLSGKLQATGARAGHIERIPRGHGRRHLPPSMAAPSTSSSATRLWSSLGHRRSRWRHHEQAEKAVACARANARSAMVGPQSKVARRRHPAALQMRSGYPSRTRRWWGWCEDYPNNPFNGSTPVKRLQQARMPYQDVQHHLLPLFQAAPSGRSRSSYIEVTQRTVLC